jgi:outer membrane lipoprotein-sorting protein
MRTTGLFACSARLAIVVVLATTAGVSAQAPADVHTILQRVGERLVEYYKRAQSLICVEKSTVQPIGADLTPRGFGRVTEYELRLEPDGDDAEQVKVVRQMLRVNGRPPRERDARDRAGCTDANPLSPEPLAFLLPARRDEYTFTFAGVGKGKDANTLILEFTSTPGSGKGELVEDPLGHEDCFSWSASLTMKGRVWVDAATYQVRRLEQRMAGMVELSVPMKLQRRHNLNRWVTVDRYDTTIQYRSVPFHDPDEAMLLPESIDTLSAIRGGLESIRRRQVFSNYKRFLTGGRVVK